MINCEQAQDLMSLYLDGELSDADRAAFEAHIAGCPACRAMLDTLAEVSALMGEDTEPPEALATGVMDGVRAINRERESEKRRRKTVFIKWLSAAACVALVIFAGHAALGGRKGFSADSAEAVRDSVTMDTATTQSAAASSGTAAGGALRAKNDTIAPESAEEYEVALDTTSGGAETPFMLMESMLASSTAEEDSGATSGLIDDLAGSPEAQKNTADSADAPAEAVEPEPAPEATEAVPTAPAFTGESTGDEPTLIDDAIAAKYRVVIYAPTVPEGVESSEFDLPDGRTGFEISYADAEAAIGAGYWRAFSWNYPTDGAESTLALIVITE